MLFCHDHRQGSNNNHQPDEAKTWKKVQQKETGNCVCVVPNTWRQHNEGEWDLFYYSSLLLLRPFIIHSLLIMNERYLKHILQLKVVSLFPFTFISSFRTTKICGVSWRSSGRQVSSTSSSPSVGSSPLQCCRMCVTSSRKGSVEWSSSSQHQ